MAERSVRAGRRRSGVVDPTWSGVVMKDRFAPRGTVEQVEEGRVFAPRFDADGLIPAIVVDAWSAEVLMLAWMNAEALARSIETGEAWFYSRSRKSLWKKGETSGHVLKIFELRVDCDQDSLLLKVEQAAAGVCHTGRPSCFYRAVSLREPAGHTLFLQFKKSAERVFDPASVYGAPKPAAPASAIGDPAPKSDEAPEPEPDASS